MFYLSKVYRNLKTLNFVHVNTYNDLILFREFRFESSQWDWDFLFLILDDNFENYRFIFYFISNLGKLVSYHLVRVWPLAYISQIGKYIVLFFVGKCTVRSKVRKFFICFYVRWLIQFLFLVKYHCRIWWHTVISFLHFWSPSC